MTPPAPLAPARLAGAPLLRTQSDERLVALLRAGNDAAFEAIVVRYRRQLLRYCSGFMSEARAEDAVQTAFVSAFKSLRSSGGEMHLRPWLYRVAHNAALNALRDRALQYEELSEEIDGVERPDQAFERKERLQDIVSAVRDLPERQREALVLRELEGRSYDEIASEFGVSDGSVRQLLNRARNTLRSGMTALTPFGLLARIPWGAPPAEGVATRVAEICAGGAGAAALTKACATVVVIGGAAGSLSGAGEGGREAVARGDSPGRATSAESTPRRSAAAATSSPGAARLTDSGSDSGRGSERSGGQDEGSAGEDRAGEDRGRREGDRDDREGNDRGGRHGGDRGRDFESDSGSGHGGGRPELPEVELTEADPGGSSGPGGGGGSESGSSGPGSGSSSGSGSGSSGSGSSGSGSGDALEE